MKKNPMEWSEVVLDYIFLLGVVDWFRYVWKKHKNWIKTQNKYENTVFI